MTGADPSSEEASLLGDLRLALAAIEEPPPGVAHDAKRAFSLRGLAAMIAQLDFDSALHDDSLSRVRGGLSSRRMTFRTESSVVDVSVMDGGRRLVGRLSPAVAERIELHHPKGSFVTETDPFGTFLFEDVPRGPVSLRCKPGRTELRTEWVTI